MGHSAVSAARRPRPWLRAATSAPSALPVEALKAVHGCEFALLWTPPYYPECQPIEMLWADVKGKVARRYRRDRTMGVLFEQLREGFDYYGTAERCAKKIAHTDKYVHACIAKHGIDVTNLTDVEDEQALPSDSEAAREGVNSMGEEWHDAQ